MVGPGTRMIPPSPMTTEITPELLLHAYAAGVFPMSEGRDDPEIFWVDPRHRGVLPLDGFHASRSLRRRIRQAPFSIRVNTDFRGVVAGCSARSETWINDEIFALYTALHQSGWAHSVEIWDQDELIGGVYGVAMGGAFFGESMYSARKDASKIALAYLVARLIAGGFSLFDTQFLTPHLSSLGGIEISRDAYRQRLRQALDQEADFLRQSVAVSPVEVLQLITQTS